MERKHKITIPEPCHENWDKMTPKENGRFCLSCSKTVIDFTSMLPEEIQHFFIENQNTNICGRFKKSQLDTITIRIPSRVLYTQTQYHKMFLLALFVAMGTTLFSCSDKNGNKQKIEKIEVVTDTSTSIPIVVGEVPMDTNNSGHALLPSPPPPKVNQVKFVNPQQSANSNKIELQEHSKKSNNNKVVLYSTIPEKCGEITPKNDNYTEETEEDFINGMVIGVNANFPGGIEQFYTFFGNEFKNPEYTNKVENKIKISFAVEKDGSLTYTKPITPIDKNIEKEIIRVLTLSPKWQPGESNGKKIRIQYSLPITLQ